MLADAVTRSKLFLIPLFAKPRTLPTFRISFPCVHRIASAGYLHTEPPKRIQIGYERAPEVHSIAAHVLDEAHGLRHLVSTPSNRVAHAV